MAQIKKKFIGDNEVGGAKVRLENNTNLRARNAANSADVNLLKLDGSDVISPQGLWNFGTLPQSSATPSSASDFTTKSYVDSQAGFIVKSPVRVASTANIASLSTLLTIDGVTLNANDRVLVKNQTTSSANGIYLAAAGSWTRATDADSAAEVIGGFIVAVTEGTTQADTVWIMASPSVTTLGTDAITFVQVGSVTLPIWEKEVFTLNGTDITNQYVDLAQVADTDSIQVVVDGVFQRESSDYTVNYTGGAGGNTRITFAGDLGTGGAAALVSGDIFQVQYQY